MTDPTGDQQDLESLRRQLAKARENLRLIDERIAEYVLATEVPLQLRKERDNLLKRIETLERDLKSYPGPRNSVEDILDKARILLDKNELDEAIKLLKIARVQHHGNEDIERLYLESVYRRGVRYYVRESNLPAAKRAFQEVVDHDRHYADGRAAQLLDEVERVLSREWVAAPTVTPRPAVPKVARRRAVPALAWVSVFAVLVLLVLGSVAVPALIQSISTVTPTASATTTPSATPALAATPTDTPTPTPTDTPTPTPIVTDAAMSGLCTPTPGTSHPPQLVAERLWYSLNDGPEQSVQREGVIQVAPDNQLRLLRLKYATTGTPGPDDTAAGEASIHKPGSTSCDGYDYMDGEFWLGDPVDVDPERNELTIIDQRKGDGSWIIKEGWDRLVVALLHYGAFGWEVDHRFFVNLQPPPSPPP